MATKEQPASTTVVLKILAEDGTIRRVRMQRTASFAAFITLLETVNGPSSSSVPISVSYLDAENERCRVTCVEELVEALHQHPKVLRVLISRAAPFPPAADSSSAMAKVEGPKRVTVTQIAFVLNGKAVTVSPATNPAVTLAIYLREVVGLKGTKLSCGEGGCGACAVLMKWTDAATGATQTRSINACLRPLALCDGVEITTVEGVGSLKDGKSKL